VRRDPLAVPELVAVTVEHKGRRRGVADTSLYPAPDGVTDEQTIFLADSLPTGCA